MAPRNSSPGYKQLPLAGLGLDNGHSTFADPAFAGNKSLPVHRWVPWIAGFSSDFVADALTKYLDKPGTVLDPFAGVGTTLVEAVLRGHNAVGFEINPYAALASEAKANAHRVDTAVLCAEIDRFQTFYQTARAKDYIPRSAYPKGFKTRSAFYSPPVRRKVLQRLPQVCVGDRVCAETGWHGPGGHRQQHPARHSHADGSVLWSDCRVRGPGISKYRSSTDDSGRQ